MPANINQTFAPDDDPVFVPFGDYVACVSADSWTSLAVQLSQSADTSDSDSWINVGSSLTANGLVTLNGGLYLKATPTGAGGGTITIRVAQTKLTRP